LYDVEPSHIQHDIRAFVQHELQKMVDLCLVEFQCDSWPQEDEVKSLVRISAGLFIAAPTALKFINPVRGSCDRRPRLQMILDSARIVSPHQSNPFEELDSIYTQVLEHAMFREQALGPHVFEAFQTIVGTIILAYGRVTANELEGLLKMDGKVRLALAELHSVILVPEDGPVQAFRPSFHDYLTDKSRCSNPKFFIGTPVRHGEIARLCLEKMICSLKGDICDIRDFTKTNNEISNLSKKKAEYLSGDLQYACRYWASHLYQWASVEPLYKLVQDFVFASIRH
jgi:hypothetical protein